MRAAIIITCLILYCNPCLSQESTKATNKIGISYSSFGENTVFRFQALDGATNYDNDKFLSLGLNYFHQLKHNLFFETGVEYSKHTLIVNLSPSVDNSSYKTDLAIINIPIAVRAVFLKYLFFNGGVLLNIDASKSSAIDSQTGIGALLGLGANYDFGSGISVYLSPYLKAHSLIPFSAANHHDRLVESGIKIGVTYTLSGKSNGL